jgi:ParB/RepB/Spo0J family partition protein
MTLPAARREEHPPDWFDDGYNPRPIVEDEDFERLIASIRDNGILQPVGALESGRMIWGRRRRRAAQKLGLKLVPVAVFPATLTEAQIIGLTMQENLLHKALSPHETYLGLIKFRDACPDMLQRDIAAASGMSEGMASQIYALEKLCPEAMEAFKAGKLGVTKAYKVATAECQSSKLAFFLNGGTREEDNQKTRKAKPVAQGDLAKRIVLPPVGKTAVTIASTEKGGEISLEDALQAVQEAARHIKAAQAKAISAKTAAAYFKDIAAAG